MFKIDSRTVKEIVEVGKNILPDAIIVASVFLGTIPWLRNKEAPEKQPAIPHHATVADSHTHHEDAHISSKKWAESVSQEALHSHARVR